MSEAWLDFNFGDKLIEASWTEENDGPGRGGIGATIRRKQDIFQRCLDVGNTNLITKYQNNLYRQKRGLAMGVADSPDLANLYGWHFEKAAGIIDDERVAFYGRYIDDCFAIVRAKDRNMAGAHLDSKIRFDGCQILWETSDLRCNFLDATFYFNEFGTRVEWRPFRKQNNHLERIPWISHHPLDVKRGTFIGEMSRLATLSSTLPVYLESLRELVSLYVKRGYPEDLVHAWVKKHLTERWEKRLIENSVKEEEGVLVLKTEYNLAWNWFNATELGNTILGYWKDWHVMCDRGHPMGSQEFLRDWPRPSSATIGSLTDVKGEFLTEVPDTAGGTIWIPDVRKIGMTDRRMIVSRKRTRNMFDYTSLWKKEVFKKLDEAVLTERDLIGQHNAAQEPRSTSASNPQLPSTSNVVGEDSDEDIIYANINPGRRSPGLGHGYFG